MKLVDLFGVGLDGTSGLPVVVLREHDQPNRMLPILVGGAEAAAIVIALTGESQPRPKTHDLMASLLQGLDGHLDAVEVTGVTDGTFIANLMIHCPGGTRQIDTRPSDAIALAVRVGAPLFVDESVLDEAGSVLELDLDGASIDEEVEHFREFLDEVEPSDFAQDDDRPSTDQREEGPDERN